MTEDRTAYCQEQDTGDGQNQTSNTFRLDLRLDAEEGGFANLSSTRIEAVSGVSVPMVIVGIGPIVAGSSTKDNRLQDETVKEVLMPENNRVRELTETEVRSVAGGVHPGGLVNQLAQYLWSRTLAR